MKNWRNIFILSILVGLAACTKVEDVYVPEAISYSVGTYANATKAHTNYTGTSFCSSAWLHANGAAAGSAFFTSEEITNTGTTWEPAHEYYWPMSQDSYLNFVSWYDSRNGSDITVSENAITVGPRTIGETDELMVAKKVWEQKSNVNPGRYYTPGVPTLFRHQLTQIGVKAKLSAPAVEEATNIRTTWEVSLKNVSFNGVYTNGTLSLTNTSHATGEDTSYWEGGWTVNTGVAATTIAATSSTTLTTTEAEIIPYRSVLPQEISGITLSVTYEVTTTTQNTSTLAQHSVKETVVASGLSLGNFEGYHGNWTMNSRITYYININPATSVITVVPIADNWTQASNEITVE